MAWIFGLAALMLLDSDTVLNAVNGAAGVFVRSMTGTRSLLEHRL